MNNFSLVFAIPSYIVIATVIFFGMFFPLLILSEFIFVEPFFIIHVTTELAFSFALILAISFMSAIVIPMNIYRIRILRKKTSKIGTSLIGAIIGASAGACSCGHIGFFIISTFGAGASFATAFLTNYEIPLRLISLGILCVVYFTTTKSISRECRIR